MKTHAEFSPVAPAVAPQHPATFPAAPFTTSPPAPAFWPVRSGDFLQNNVFPFAQRTAGPRSIYVVDDDASLVELYTIFLKDSNYLVTAFYDRAEALVALEKTSKGPDLLITDFLGHAMPIDWFLERSLVVHPTLRVLMASGLSLAHVPFCSAWPDRFIQKPFTAKELLTEVRAALAA